MFVQQAPKQEQMFTKQLSDNFLPPFPEFSLAFFRGNLHETQYIMI